MIRFLTYGLILLFSVSACTNPRWMIKDRQTVDPNEYKKISSREFLMPAGNVTPEVPILRLQVLSENTYEYAEKVLMARYVQDYKLNPFFFAAGLLGAGLTFYIANSKDVTGINGNLKTVTLNVAGGIIALGSIMNFSPSGEPRPTGEERFLKRTGSRMVTDTLQVNVPGQDRVPVDIFYGDQGVAEDLPVKMSGGMMEVDLGSPLSILGISGKNPDSVRVYFNYADSTYSYAYPLKSILRPFVKVETSVTELRNSPEDVRDNILAELVEGSQLQIVEETDSTWYKVLYGISENYVSRSDVSQVWHKSDFAMGNRVVAVPTVPFGDIDVENNIPILSDSNLNGIGLIIGSEEYSGSYSTRKYTERDGRLIETYLVHALGYPKKKVHRLNNIESSQPVDSLWRVLEQTANDSSEIIVYLSGYGSLEKGNGQYNLFYLPSGASGDSKISLGDLLNRVAKLPSKSTVIINDIDFSQSVQNLPEALPSFQQPLYNIAASVTSGNEDTAILFSSGIKQNSHVYLGTDGDKKHHIFPYFFAKAIQNRNTNIAEIYQYLQRNVSYTSRRLHNEPQEPLLFGNQAIDLANRE